MMELAEALLHMSLYADNPQSVQFVFPLQFEMPVVFFLPVTHLSGRIGRTLRALCSLMSNGCVISCCLVHILNVSTKCQFSRMSI